MGKPKPAKIKAAKLVAETELDKQEKPKATSAKTKPTKHGNAKAVSSAKAIVKTRQKRKKVLQVSASVTENQRVSKRRRVGKQEMSAVANNKDQEDERMKIVGKLRTLALTYAQKLHGFSAGDVASPQILKTVQEMLDSTSQTFRQTAKQETSRPDGGVDSSQESAVSASSGRCRRVKAKQGRDVLKPQTPRQRQQEVKQEDPGLQDEKGCLYCEECQIEHPNLFCPLKYVNFDHVPPTEEIAFRRGLLEASEEAGRRYDEEERLRQRYYMGLRRSRYCRNE